MPVLALAAWLALLFAEKSGAMGYWFGTHEFRSENRKYVLSVTGLGWETFYGECTFALCDSSRRELWKKRMVYAGHSAVSNSGETAIPIYDGKSRGVAIHFYDRRGNWTGGLFPRQPSGDWMLQGELGPYIVHGYAPDGLTYCIFSQGAEDTSVYFTCTNRLGKPRWRVKLKDPSKNIWIQYTPSEIQFSGNRILIDDFGMGAADYTNRAYLIDRSAGKIVWERPFPHADPGAALLEDDKEVLLFQRKFGDFILRGLNLASMKERSVPVQDVFPLLLSSRPRAVRFALICLHFALDAPEITGLRSLPDQVVAGLKELARMDIHSGETTETSNEYVKSLLKKLHIEDVLYRNDIPYTGKIVEHFPDGKIKSEVSYLDGRKHGTAVYWYANGVKQKEARYTRDVLDGKFSEWYHSGQIQATCTYKNGEIVGDCTYYKGDWHVKNY
jgi:hypothetical protein